MDKKNPSKNINKLPNFTWGGTNPQWTREAKIIADKIEDVKAKDTEEKDNKHYYLRDYN